MKNYLSCFFYDIFFLIFPMAIKQKKSLRQWGKVSAATKKKQITKQNKETWKTPNIIRKINLCKLKNKQHKIIEKVCRTINNTKRLHGDNWVILFPPNFPFCSSFIYDFNSFYGGFTFHWRFYFYLKPSAIITRHSLTY